MCVGWITLRRVAAALWVLPTIACLPAAAEAVRDAAGRSVEVKDASRIVSIGGDHTIALPLLRAVAAVGRMTDPIRLALTEQKLPAGEFLALHVGDDLREIDLH